MWPDRPLIGQLIFYFSVAVFLGTTLWFFLSKRRTKVRGRRRNYELIGNVVSVCFVGLAIGIGWLLFSADARYAASINLVAGARVEFPNPIWSKKDDGTWQGETVIRISGKFVRTGVVVGIKADGLKDIQAAAPYGQCCIPSPYGGFPALGTHRLYIPEPRADYALRFVTTEQRVTFQYQFEGEREGPSVTWEAPKP